MAALACTTVTLLDAAKGLISFSDRELLAAEVMLREQLDAKADGRTARTPSQLMAAAVSFFQLSDHVQSAIEVRQLCQSAVDNAARTSCAAVDIRSDIRCYCGISNEDLRALIAFLKCAAR